MLIQFVMVGLGGALGSMLRYLISLIPVNNTFPFLTLITNLLGALLIGFIVGLSDNLLYQKSFCYFLKPVYAAVSPRFQHFHLKPYNCFSAANIFWERFTQYSVSSCVSWVSFSENILGGSLFKQQNYIVSP